MTTGSKVLEDAWLLDVKSGKWREVRNFSMHFLRKVVKHVQVRMPANLQGRLYHSATAISPRPGLEEVILYGGCPEWPANFRTADEIPKIANTTVLTFGECGLFEGILCH